MAFHKCETFMNNVCVSCGKHFHEAQRDQSIFEEGRKTGLKQALIHVEHVAEDVKMMLDDPDQWAMMRIVNVTLRMLIKNLQTLAKGGEI